MDADGLLQLLDVLGASLSEGCLGLTVALLALLGSGIDLVQRLACVCEELVGWNGAYRLATSLSFGLFRVLGIVMGRSSLRLGRRLNRLRRGVSHVFLFVDRHVLVHCNTQK